MQRSHGMRGAKTEDEGLYPIQHGYWRDEMVKALARESAHRIEQNTQS